MKFAYVDESGARNRGDVFVMCGVMVDAYKLRTKTQDFDALLEEVFQLHPGRRADFKTSRFINGIGGWNVVDGNQRKQILTDICRVAVANGGKIFGFGMSFARFDRAVAETENTPFGQRYWLASALFVASLIQKQMQKVSHSKGLTVLIMDDNKMEMPLLSDALHDGSPWLDGLYKVNRRVRNRPTWVGRTGRNRFDQLINTGFAIKSDHSSMVQVADAISYVYRRKLELSAGDEAWVGERAYFDSLVDILQPARISLGRTPNEPCKTFYEAAKHPQWQL
jgi:hypothetical protein